MKIRRRIPLSLIAMLVIPMMANGAILTEGEDVKTTSEPQRFIVKLDSDSPDSGGTVVDLSNVMFSTADGMVVDGDHPNMFVKALVLGDGPNNIESGGPWLGVKFGPVPKPLASHLQLESGKGQMVLNVLEGSPADLAGFQQYDVITAIDNQEATTDIGAFLDQIRAFEPNDISNFDLIRAGRATTATVTIGTRPDDVAASNYKYEDDMAHVAQGNVFRRGGIVRKDDDGKWVFGGTLSDDDGFKWSSNLHLDDAHFNAILKDVPFGLQRDITVQSINGESVQIETGDDGRITVTRETKNGDDTTETTATYTDEAEFEQVDPDTYEMYKSRHGDLHSFMWKSAGNGLPHRMLLDGNHADFDFDVDLMVDGLDGLDEQISVMLKRIGAADDITADVQLRIDDAMKRADDLGKHMKIFTTKTIKQGAGQGAQTSIVVVENGKATTVNIGSDGAVTLTTRDGDDEVVETFDSIDSLKESRPELAGKLNGVFMIKSPKAADK